MTFDWYRIINRTEFEASGLVSKSVNLIMGTLGRKTALVTRGNYTCVTVDGVMLSADLSGTDPFIFGNRAVYVDDAGDIWFGVLNEG